MTGTFLPQVRLPDMNLSGRQVVEEEARCYLLHEDLRALEGEEDKRPPGGSAPGSPAFPANFARTSIIVNPMTIAVSGESAEQKPPSVSADYQH